MEKAARRIVEKLRRNGHESLFAGGWVRDRLLGRAADDIDIATSARPAEVLALFPNSTAIGASFGVVQVRAYGRAYEVATFRSEGPYLDGRHPSSVAFSSPRQDAFRRDFTINGLFYDPIAGLVVDYVRGRADLRRCILRAIGKPRDRFSEDRLRMLRAVRLACKLGFRIAPSTWRAVQSLAPAIMSVSGERVRDELLKLLTGSNRARGLTLLHESGLLAHILPEIQAMVGARQDSRHGDPFTETCSALALLRKPSSELSLGTLLHRTSETAAREICRRLRLPNASTAQVADLVANHPRFALAREMRVSALMRLLGKANIRDHLELLRVSRLSRGGSLDDYTFCLQILKYLSREPAPRPLLTGRDLIDLGYTPGPQFREILEAVEDLRLERSLRTRQDAVEHVRRTYPRNPVPAREGAQ